MTEASIVLIGDLLIAPLLAAVIYYTLRLHRRLETLRGEQQQLTDLIGKFGSAAERADHATSNLKAAGIEAEKSVRTVVARAESMRDELAFLIERADHASARVGDAARPAQPASKRAPSSPAAPVELNPGQPTPAVRSEAERDLIHAMRRANGRS
jgi:hypothetical protein